MTRLISIALFVVLTACVPQRQWRTVPYYAPEADSTAKTEQRFVIPPDTGNNRIYSLSFAEFRNNGEPYDPRQLQEAVQVQAVIGHIHGAA